MAEDRKVRINIETKGDPSGADATARALEKVANAEERIEDNANALDKLASAEKRAESAAETLEQSQRRLIAAQDAAIAKIKAKDAAQNKAAAGSKNFGAAIGQAGFQVQDFVVQVGAGQSALVALGQQGSQLLGMFGPGGAVAGALLAFGAIAVKIFTETGESAEEAQEKAREAAEAVMELAKSLGSEDFENFTNTLSNIAQGQLDVYDATVNQNEAIRDQRRAQDEIEKGWRNAAKAAIDYLAATDPAFNKDAAISALEGADRQAGRDSAIQAEQDRINQAREVYNKIFVERENLIEREAELLRKREELERKQQEFNSRIQQLQETQGDTGINEIEINSLKTDLERVESALSKTNADINTKLKQEFNNLEAKGRQNSEALQAVINEATTNIERINEQFNADESAARAKAATEQVKKGAEALQTFVSDFEALTPAQQQAEANIAAALADGKITADEMIAVTTDLKLLQGSLKTGQEGQRENIQSLIDLMGSLITANQQQAREIEGLKARLATPIK